MPVENVAILSGVDRFMSEARSITNLIGNGIATIIIAKREKEFDEQAYQLAVNQDFLHDAVNLATSGNSLHKQTVDAIEV